MSQRPGTAGRVGRSAFVQREVQPDILCRGRPRLLSFPLFRRLPPQVSKSQAKSKVIIRLLLLIIQALTRHSDNMNKSHPVGLLIGSEDIVLSITAFLSAKDCLNLHAVSRAFHHCLSGRIDETLFEKHLRCDFDEGEVLVYVAEKKNLSYKKLYRAFRGRWSLPKQVDPTSSQTDYWMTKIAIPWSKQSVSDIPIEQYRGAKILVPNNDIDNVVFIASIGGEDGDTRSALLDWNPECTSWQGAPRPLGQLSNYRQVLV